MSGRAAGQVSGPCRSVTMCRRVSGISVASCECWRPAYRNLLVACSARERTFRDLPGSQDRVGFLLAELAVGCRRVVQVIVQPCFGDGVGRGFGHERNAVTATDFFNQGVEF